MIELLTSAKTSPLSQKSNSSSVPKDDSFQKYLDNSLSEQKSLARELKQAEINDKNKKITVISEKIEQLKKELEKTNPKELEKLIPLEEILSFLTNSLQELSDVGDTAISQIEGSFESSDLITWIDTVSNFVDQVVENFSQTGIIEDKNFFMAQKISFLLEDINVQQDLNKPQTNLVKENTLMSIFKDTSRMVEQDISKVQQEIVNIEDVESVGTKELVLGMEILDEPIKMDTQVLGDTIKSEETTKLSFNSEFSGDTTSEGGASDEGADPNQKVFIKDLRSKENSENTVGVKSFSLENIDEAVQATDGEMVTEIEQKDITIQTVSSKNESLTLAQKMYTALSSSISRVQVESLMQNMAGRIAMIFQDGGNELRMKLTPPELGAMKLSFTTEDSVMIGKLVVETQEAKMFFEQNIDNLRESLAQAGVTLGSIDIEFGTQNDFEDQEQEEGIQAVRNPKINKVIEERKSMLNDSLVDFTA